jgi:uncharacterized protein YlxW (UPF0749 family)
MLVAALLIGVLLSVQWPSDATWQGGGSDQVMQTILRLELEQAELKRKVGLLREELDAQQQAMGSSTRLLEDLNVELTRQKTLAGLVDARGEGVEITLDDSPRPSGGSASDHLIHDYDLRDVVNLMWIAGAEAIAINDERIVNSSSVYCVGSTVLVNDTRLSPPYKVKAIGTPRVLLDYIENPGYLSELKMRQARVGVRLEPVLVESVFVPAYMGSLPLKYAKPGS